ncbi:sre G protein-coupled chemoreceptor domain-containing protein [Ditylenchus destructor]|uniref:Sre G protein-coupled chemoreceptor domain-containing protein n=1 Tax=Ditylenchus destructor TaxID=166010 RepID=A0AAD4NCY2_9BILA|nr:sre G protein-coupled chemoreceptor domain-containing protein [Ditylenchus destructor]
MSSGSYVSPTACSLPEIPVDSIAIEVKSIHTTYFAVFLLLESIALIISGASVLMTVVMFNKHSHIMHVNCYRIMLNLILQYIAMHLIARVVEIILMFHYYNLCSNNLEAVTAWRTVQHPRISPFYWTNLAKVYLIMLGAFTLPAFVSERVCAMLFVSDYEQNTRWPLSIALLTTSNGLALLFNAIISFQWLDMYFVVALIVILNITALIVSYCCKWRSTKFYMRNLLPKNDEIYYSLSERYLSAQNIRVSRILAKLIMCVGILNIFLSIVYIERLSSSNLVPLAVNYELFDFVIALYAIFIPMVIRYESKVFKREVRKIVAPVTVRSFCICLKHNKTSALFTRKSHDASPLWHAPPVLENVLGVKLTHQTPQLETEAYFARLEQLWQQ